MRQGSGSATRAASASRPAPAWVVRAGPGARPPSRPAPPARARATTGGRALIFAPASAGGRAARSSPAVAEGVGVGGVGRRAVGVVGLGRADVDQAIEQRPVALGRVRARPGPRRAGAEPAAGPSASPGASAPRPARRRPAPTCQRARSSRVAPGLVAERSPASTGRRCATVGRAGLPLLEVVRRAQPAQRRQRQDRGRQRRAGPCAAAAPRSPAPRPRPARARPPAPAPARPPGRP